MSTRVAIVTLGCARNEVDSEELAARLSKDGVALVSAMVSVDELNVETITDPTAITAITPNADELMALYPAFGAGESPFDPPVLAPETEVLEVASVVVEQQKQNSAADKSKSRSSPMSFSTFDLVGLTCKTSSRYSGSA